MCMKLIPTKEKDIIFVTNTKQKKIFVIRAIGVYSDVRRSLFVFDGTILKGRFTSIDVYSIG